MYVLLVEDDDAFADGLVRGLGLEGFEVRRVSNGAEALNGLTPDIVLLDVGLPDIDGYEVCRQLRARSDVPIVLLTARSAEDDRVLGLDIGADDYVVKPFGLRELAARLRAVARRRTPAERTSPVLRVGALHIDSRTCEVTVSGRPLELTPIELRLLTFLAAGAGTVLRRQTILEAVWGHPWYGPTKTLDVHVSSLRKKLGRPGWIEAVRGIGFQFVPQE